MINFNQCIISQVHSFFNIPLKLLRLTMSAATDPHSLDFRAASMRPTFTAGSLHSESLRR